jgi:hypothetical protein
MRESPTRPGAGRPRHYRRFRNHCGGPCPASAPGSGSLFIIGDIDRGNGDHNLDWNWHILPGYEPCGRGCRFRNARGRLSHRLTIRLAVEPRSRNAREEVGHAARAVRSWPPPAIVDNPLDPAELTGADHAALLRRQSNGSRQVDPQATTVDGLRQAAVADFLHAGY